MSARFELDPLVVVTDLVPVSVNSTARGEIPRHGEFRYVGTLQSSTKRWHVFFVLRSKWYGGKKLHM